LGEIAVELREVTKAFPGYRGGVGLTAVDRLNLQIKTGEFFTLLGPSGCGKTTTLRMIAGFERATAGEIFIQGEPMNDVPPNRRPVNTVFQNYALFPHLNVLQNVSFGLRVKRFPRSIATKRAAEALELVRLPGLEERRPSQLSGGQQQRVALARALVNEPAVLLLDEPLGALDLKLRKQMQLELKQLQVKVGITFIYVTHDQEEALTMSDRIAVMDMGQLLQVDAPVSLYENPATRFVADFIGETNFLTATVTHVNESTVDLQVAGQVVAARLGQSAVQPGQTVSLAIRPEKVVLLGGAAVPENRFSQTLPGEVREVVFIGTDTRYTVQLANEETLVARVQNAGGGSQETFAVGDTVQVCWTADDARALVD
jgi:spermidine/putrescine transport system ATP-binding protein